MFYFLSLFLFISLLAANPPAVAATKELERNAGTYHVILRAKPENMTTNQSTSIQVSMNQSEMDNSGNTDGNNSKMSDTNMSSSMDQAKEPGTASGGHKAKETGMAGMDKATETDTASGPNWVFLSIVASIVIISAIISSSKGWGCGCKDN